MNWKKSIRFQLAAVFIILLLAVIAAIFFVNTAFLTRYYISNKKAEIVDSYEQMNALSQSLGVSSEGFKSGADRLTADKSLLVVVADPGMKILYTTERESKKMTERLLWRAISGDPIQEPGNETAEDVRSDRGAVRPPEDVILYETDEYKITKSRDPAMKSDYIELWGYMSSGDLIFIRTPLESIRESVYLSTRFMLYIGILIALVGVVVIWFVTRRITDPILKLTEISDRMAHLDFDVRYESEVHNEIGELGLHMNEMSMQLESAISDLKSANLKLQQDIEKKEQIENMRNEFISNVSHELKTPIALISGYAEGLRDGIADDEESRNEYLNVIIDESDKMGDLVKSLLELNHIEFGSRDVEMQRFDLVPVIAGIISSSEILLRQFGVSVTFEEDAPRYVWSDESMTEDVFTNYLTNAIHYAGGEKRISVTVEDRGENVRVTVFNTGDNISDEDMDRIWEKFYKVDKARTREVGGSGVGLSIVKAVMETLNKPFGVINYDDGVGFWFELESASGNGNAGR